MKLSREEELGLKEVITRKGLASRGFGIWAGSLIGLGFGLLGGAGLGLMLPAIMGSAFTGTAFFSAMAIGGAAGVLQGRAAGADNGSPSGAVYEGTRRVMNEIDLVRDDLNAIKTSLGLPASPARAESLIPEQESNSIGAWARGKGGLICFALGALLGALVGGAALLFGDASPVATAFVQNLGLGAAGTWSAGAATVGLTAVGGGFSALTLGVDVPRMLAKGQRLAQETMLSRFDFEGKPTPALPEKQPSLAPSLESSKDASSSVNPSTQIKEGLAQGTLFAQPALAFGK